MKLCTSSVVTGLVLGLGIAGAAMSLGQGEKPDAISGAAKGALEAFGIKELKDDKPVAAAPDAAAMEAWMKSMKLGEQHGEFKKYVGEWTTSTKVMMPGAPEAPASTGSASFKLLMDGRFLEQTYSGNMMGMPMEGMGLMGFDNNRKLFVNTWVDNFSTGMMMMKGNKSQDGKTLTMIGEMDEPMTGEMGKAIRSQTKWLNENSFKFTMDEIIYGEPFTVLEVTYTRKK